MPGEESWLKRAEAVTLFSNRGKGAEAARMLEVAPANKTVADREQAILLQIGRILECRLRGLYPKEKEKYAWVSLICNNLEITQQTMAGETNSRMQFTKIAVAQFQGAINKAKNMVEDFANK